MFCRRRWILQRLLGLLLLRGIGVFNNRDSFLFHWYIRCYLLLLYFTVLSYYIIDLEKLTMKSNFRLKIPVGFQEIIKAKQGDHSTSKPKNPTTYAYDQPKQPFKNFFYEKKLRNERNRKGFLLEQQQEHIVMDIQNDETRHGNKILNHEVEEVLSMCMDQFGHKRYIIKYLNQRYWLTQKQITKKNPLRLLEFYQKYVNFNSFDRQTQMRQAVQDIPQSNKQKIVNQSHRTQVNFENMNEEAQQQEEERFFIGKQTNDQIMEQQKLLEAEIQEQDSKMNTNVLIEQISQDLRQDRLYNIEQPQYEFVPDEDLGPQQQSRHNKESEVSQK